MEQQYSIIEKHFYYFILNSNYDIECDDEQWLSDFSGCDLNDFMLDQIADQYDLIDKTNMLYSQTKKLYSKLRYQYWEKHLKQKLSIYYCLDLQDSNVSLQEIFKQIALTNDLSQLQEELNQHCIKDYPSSCHQLYSSEEIQNLIKTTTNPIFYAKHTGVSKEQAQRIISQRENEHCVYKAYRPNLSYAH